MIIPTILTNSMDELIQKLDQTAKFSSRVSIDVIDTTFAESTTLQAGDLRQVDWRGLELDVQLLVDVPESHISRLPTADIKRVIGQVEHMKDLRVFMDECQLYGIQPGLGLDLETSISDIAIEDYRRASVVLLMSVPAGRSGQVFDVQVLEKIKILRARGYEGDIMVDGGMNLDTVALALDAGATLFCVNSFIWKSDNPQETYDQLVELLPNETNKY